MECAPDTVSLSSDQSEQHKQNFESEHNSILSGKLLFKSPTKAYNRNKKTGGEKPTFHAATPSKVNRISNTTETDVEEPFFKSPRAHKIPLKPELGYTEGPFTKSDE